MIPVRLVLRALTVQALTRGMTEPFPTMAGAFVHDTKLTPLIDVKGEGQVPSILIYTDEDKRVNLDKNNKRTWKRTISLVIEVAVSNVMRGKDGLEFEPAEVDPELEALLDLFEAEVEAALYDPSNPWALAWMTLVKTIDQWTSEPFRSAEQANRYAVRQIHLECELNTDCRFPVITTSHVPLAADDLLGVPYLTGLSEEIMTNPLFASTRDLLTRTGIQMPKLKNVMLTTSISPTSVANEVVADINTET